MREYETVFITKPDLPESQLKQISDRLKALIEKNSGQMFFVKDMGRRTLSYPIAKQTKGVYTCLDYGSEGSVIGELERVLKLDDNVLRFLTVQKNECVDPAARAAEIAARGEDKLPLSTEAAPLIGKDSDTASDDIDDVANLPEEE